MCLNCCREIRQGSIPAGEHASSADQQSLVRVKSLGSKVIGGSQYKLPPWHAKDDGAIPCPPSERGGCGSRMLVLKRILKSNWLAKLVAEVNALVSGEDQKSHLAMPTSKADTDIVEDRRRSAFRLDSYDNFLYCPAAQDVRREGLDCFYRHWLNGEPIIIRNMIDEIKDISWEPDILSCAVRDCMQNKMIKVLDCLQWCPVILFFSIESII
jgi:lysine-specific demethylase 3